ncbi:choice-of-anchor M domain-containing protein [Microbacterium marinilacus]|uniref:Surface-anchored protein n=1 Tax=Microbacterium marinilacus TaxID=415209 RepID=A0ABP7BJM4_9MICO|nr:choice-of-anchor M domain-containing protein [Microbacterium marinilacus]MBY0687649.1 choice-of-anchor M domain-containing protein [Microbacterium marinilacus]
MHQVSRTRSRQIASVAVLGVALAAVPTSAAFAYDPSDGREVLGAGVHVDAIYPEIEDGRLEVHTLTPDGVVDADTVLLHIPSTESSQVTLPEGYEFLGPEGTDAWVTTEAQDPSVVWPGWSFEGIEQGVLKGTVKIAYEGFSYAGGGDEPRFAVTQPGGFEGDKVTPVIVPGTTFTSTSGEVGGHTHATWTFTEEGVYDIDFTVEATLADETPISDDVTVRFVVGELGATDGEPQPQQDPEVTDSVESLTVVPSKVDAEYFVGQTVNLTALSPDAAEADVYHWYVTKPGESEAVVDEEQTTNTFSTKPVRGIDGAEVYVERTSADGDVLETSEPLEIGVRAIEPTTALSVTADADSYQAGDTAHFTSAQAPQTDDEHYHWYLKLAGEDEYAWIPESRLADQDLEITSDMDGATITARLFNADHSVLAESPVLHLSVGDDDATDIEPLAVTADRDGYAVGDEASFTADGVDDADTVEWSVRKSGENVFTALEETAGATLVAEVGEDWDGAEIRAVVRDGSNVSAEGSLPAVALSGEAADDDAPAAGDEAGVPVLTIVIAAVIALAIIVIVVLLLRARRKRSAE